MDLQGTPIGSSTQGTKNTTDPGAKLNPKYEGAGPVASDSLAAESDRAGGGFSENAGSEPLGVSGSSSTFNNTDTSGAATLDAAPNAAEREDRSTYQETSGTTEGPGGVKYPEGLGGQGDFSGQHSLNGYSGGPTSDKQALSSGSATYDTSGSTGAPDSAPSYISTANTASAQSGKPHGKNITEGGFDSDPSNNASFTSDIGDKDDPGRLSENHLQRQTLESGIDAGASGPRQKEITGDGQYDVLETEQGL